MRQFGYQQFIPINPILPMDGTARPRNVNRYKVRHYAMESEWSRYVPGNMICGKVDEMGLGKVEDGYRPWYCQRTHIRIDNSNDQFKVPPAQKTSAVMTLYYMAQRAHPYQATSLPPSPIEGHVVIPEHIWTDMCDFLRPYMDNLNL